MTHVAVWRMPPVCSHVWAPIFKLLPAPSQRTHPPLPPHMQMPADAEELEAAQKRLAPLPSFPHKSTPLIHRPPLPPAQVPSDAEELEAARRRLAAHYPLAAFAAARRRLDPKNILGSPALDALLPRDV